MKATPVLTRAIKALEPKEGAAALLMVDNRTKAGFVECHVRGSKIIELGTTDVPLDPDDQSDYRANREMVVNAPAFQKMKDDALKGRTFSNIVAEFSEEFEPDRPLKIIGGQHRFEAIKQALAAGIDEWHGLKIYLSLDKAQRLDVQLISNTSIAISPDLYDRMQETVRGPKLREWCQSVGLLSAGEDFTDKRQRGGEISVQFAKTFILNFFLGRTIEPKNFDKLQTTPIVPKKGQEDSDWERFLAEHPTYFENKELSAAARHFAKLETAQRQHFEGKKAPADYREKAMNLAVLAGWAFVAGCLTHNKTRQAKHFALEATTKHDPLNAAALAGGRHKTDPENYRGLGYRTDPKERGRFAELFFYQAETGAGINKQHVDVAIKKYHAKQAFLEAEEAQAKD